MTDEAERLTALQEIIERALAEDIGSGDVTSETILPVEHQSQGRFLAKATGVISGLEVVKQTFATVDEAIRFEPLVAEGQAVEKGAILAEASGPTRSLLSAERLALNFLQRMSGIATLTRRFVTAVAHTNAIILDTRKTVPGLRLLDKAAVAAGGAQNHRFGLYDMVLIKDNHIAAAGSISLAVTQVRSGDPQRRPIEVEVKNLAELQEALPLKVNRIMLDNMSLNGMHQAVEITAGQTPLEASGNVNLQTVADIAATGVDYISVGQLTHSVEALDISFKLES